MAYEHLVPGSCQVFTERRVTLGRLVALRAPWHYLFIEQANAIPMGLLSTLLWPTLVAASPLGALGGLLRLRPVTQSAGWMAVATVVVGVFGCASTGLAVLLCANSLAEGMPAGGPKCVTGAAVFLPLGLAFTCGAVGWGAVRTMLRVVEHWKRA